MRIAFRVSVLSLFLSLCVFVTSTVAAETTPVLREIPLLQLENGRHCRSLADFFMHITGMKCFFKSVFLGGAGPGASAGTGRYGGCLWLRKRIYLSNIWNVPHVLVYMCALKSYYLIGNVWLRWECECHVFQTPACINIHSYEHTCTEIRADAAVRCIFKWLHIDEVWIYLTSKMRKTRCCSLPLMMFYQ